MISFFILIPLFLCWGSFLNMLSYRLIHTPSVKNLVQGRSYCPYCNQFLAWYDLVPVISWFLLAGKCRSCGKSISYLYPTIEILTALLLTLLVLWVPIDYFIGYFIFFSALIISIRTDLETMLISRLATLFLIPISFACCIFNWLPITPIESIAGILFGTAFLSFTSWLFRTITKKEGLGQGDIELLAYIGSVTGPLGVWVSLLLGSFVGSIIGISYMVIYKKGRSLKIPFGPFLALGALIFVLFHQTIEHFLQVTLYT